MSVTVTTLAVATKKIGEYSASLVVPRPGTWAVEIDGRVALIVKLLADPQRTFTRDAEQEEWGMPKLELKKSEIAAQVHALLEVDERLVLP